MNQQKLSPLRYHPSFETVPADEAETQQGLSDAMLAIQRRTHADTGYAYRAVHAKAHGYLIARFEVLPDLPPQLAQGLFAEPASYDAVLRFSTTPGDILDDNVSMPRGAALKVLNVPGARLPAARTRRPRIMFSATRPRSRSAPRNRSSSNSSPSLRPPAASSL